MRVKIELVQYNQKNRIVEILIKLNRQFVPSLEERIDIQVYAKKLQQNAVNLFASLEGQDIGHCAIYLNQKDKAYISSFGVLEMSQRCGAGSQLMNKALEEVRKRNIHEVELQVHRDNEKAIQFYQKQNFRVVKQEEDWLVMVHKIM